MEQAMGKWRVHALSKGESCYSAPDTVLRELNLVILSREAKKHGLYVNFTIFKNTNAQIKCDNVNYNLGTIDYSLGTIDCNLRFCLDYQKKTIRDKSNPNTRYQSKPFWLSTTSTSCSIRLPSSTIWNICTSLDVWEPESSPNKKFSWLTCLNAFRRNPNSK